MAYPEGQETPFKHRDVRDSWLRRDLMAGVAEIICHLYRTGPTKACSILAVRHRNGNDRNQAVTLISAQPVEVDIQPGTLEVPCDHKLPTSAGIKAYVRQATGIGL